MKHYVGLDIGLAKTAVCCLDDKGVLVFETMVVSEPSALISKLSTLRSEIEMIGLEACPLSEWLHRCLTEEGYEVFCLETRHTQRFLSTRPNKTDRTDAHGIATMMRLGHFKPVHVKSQPAQLTRAILIGRKQFMGSMIQLENTIRGLLRVQGRKLGKPHRNAFSARAYQLCEHMPEILLAIEPLLIARDAMRVQMKTLYNTLGRQARNDPVCKLFMTVPGVGPQTSHTFKGNNR